MTHTTKPSDEAHEVNGVMPATEKEIPSNLAIKAELHHAFSLFFPPAKDQKAINAFLNHMDKFIDGETKPIARHNR